jgi:hypothetical protein
LDSLLVPLVIGLAVAAVVFLPLLGLMIIRHKDRLELDHYGKYRGSGPAKSFVCPECLSRTYAPSHVANRWCSRCQKGFSKEPSNAGKKKRWEAVEAPAWYEEQISAARR